MFVQSASAQHYIGLKGGYGAAMGRFYPKYEAPLVWNKDTGGVMWKYYSAQQVVGGVSVELEYQMRGYRVYAGVVADNETYARRSRTVNSITMPIIWQPHIYFAKQRVRLFINAGFTLTYNLGIGETTSYYKHNYNPETGEVTIQRTSEKYKMIPARDNRINYGICGGLGLSVSMGRFEIFAEARYYYGMSDIMRTSSKYQFNNLDLDPYNPDPAANSYPVIRSELDNLFVTVGVFFRLGKGGIKEPPLSFKRKAVPPSDSDFRNIKLNNMRYR